MSTARTFLEAKLIIAGDKELAIPILDDTEAHSTSNQETCSPMKHCGLDLGLGRVCAL